MDETQIIEHTRQLYPDGCVVTLYVDKSGTRLINTEVATLKEGGQE